LRNGIHRLKYEGEPARAASLAPLLFAAAADFPNLDALVPAPLHRSRLKRRGYNQADLLAAPVAERLGRPLVQCLARTRPTRQQVRLDADARRDNVEGAFAVPEPTVVSGRRLLLVDDVITTGSTLNACADALHGVGAAWVGVLTLARDC
jgi:ComF family protein